MIMAGISFSTITFQGNSEVTFRDNSADSNGGVMYIDYQCTTVYCKLFKVEKFCGFRGLIGDRETFPAKHFRSSF